MFKGSGFCSWSMFGTVFQASKSRKSKGRIAGAITPINSGWVYPRVNTSFGTVPGTPTANEKRCSSTRSCLKSP